MSSLLVIFVPKEIVDGEKRVAATPVTIAGLLEKKVRRQHEVRVVVESGAGEASGISDAMYLSAGAEVISNVERGYADASVVLAVGSPSMHPELKKHQIDMLTSGACWISMFDADPQGDHITRMKLRSITSFSLTLLPRITRAQRMDVLSSQSNLAGYKAMIMAADTLGKMIPMMMTAAGTIQPAKVVILGAGVAGLQAVATAKRLGAQVEVSDIRPAVKEQVESLGAKFIEVPVDDDMEDEKGYAKNASAEYLQRQQVEVAQRVALADIVITTALVPGRPAPRLVTREMVASMRPGSVIVDMAAVAGGNCELTVSGETVMRDGVTIIGMGNLPSLIPVHASQFYAKNISTFVLELIRDGAFIIDREDEITSSCLVTHEGEFVKH